MISFLIVSRYPTVGLCDAAATPKRSERRSVATRSCISPCPHSTTSCASGLCTRADRRVFFQELRERLA